MSWEEEKKKYVLKEKEVEEEFDLNKSLIDLFKHTLIYITLMILIGVIIWKLIN